MTEFPTKSIQPIATLRLIFAYGRAARARTASCAVALARLVRPRADSRARTNRSSANPVGPGMQACQPAVISLNSPLGHNLK